MTAYRALVYSVLSTLRFDRFDWGRHFDLAPDAFEILAVLLGKDWPPSMVAGLPLTMLCRTRRRDHRTSASTARTRSARSSSVKGLPITWTAGSSTPSCSSALRL